VEVLQTFYTMVLMENVELGSFVEVIDFLGAKIRK
jgi:hypothetical protein